MVTEAKEIKAKPAKAQAKETKPKVQAAGNKLAAVVIRGIINARHDFIETLRFLNLYNQHNCVILNNTPVIRGMLHKVKDFITYGPVSDEVIVELEKTRKAKKIHGKTYRLNPPRGGFERKGIKKSYSKGGALGSRKSMDPLIRKML